jgi:hypothetical protein
VAVVPSVVVLTLSVVFSNDADKAFSIEHVIPENQSHISDAHAIFVQHLVTDVCYFKAVGT